MVPQTNYGVVVDPLCHSWSAVYSSIYYFLLNHSYAKNCVAFLVELKNSSAACMSVYISVALITKIYASACGDSINCKMK